MDKERELQASARYYFYAFEALAILFLASVYLAPLPIFVHLIATFFVMWIAATVGRLASMSDLRRIELERFAWLDTLTLQMGLSQAVTRYRLDHEVKFDWEAAQNDALEDIKRNARVQSQINDFFGPGPVVKGLTATALVGVMLLRPTAALALALAAEILLPGIVDYVFRAYSIGFF
jgi:hypothetical protein